MRYHVFVDFDGTVTADDVGYNFFRHFARGKAEAIVRQYRRGKISADECLGTECEIYNENPAPAGEISDFIDSQEMTPGFPQFVELCQARQIKMTVLSAGFDFYINPLLKKYGLEFLKTYYTPTTIKNGRIYPDFIYYDQSICPQCVNCKGGQIKRLTAQDEVSIFIGDGHSDCHGAKAADLVFAKSFLAEYLDDENIDYYSYYDFFDVINRFREILRED